MTSNVEQIIGHLKGRLIPTDVQVAKQMPAGYEEELSDRYEERMSRRARRFLQQVDPKKRRAILAFFEHEEQVRGLLAEIDSRRSRLQEIGYDPNAIKEVNHIYDLLKTMREEIVRQSHSDLIEEHPTMGLFAGEKSEVSF